MKQRKWNALAGSDREPVTLAVDTEFQGNETLTVQVAVRMGNEVRVQLYYSPEIPPPRADWFGKPFLKRFPGRVVVLPAREITHDLSPARMLADVFGLPQAEYLSRYEGDDRRAAGDHAERVRRQKGTAPPLDVPHRIAVVVSGHFLRADLLRMFGRAFLKNLLDPEGRPAAVGLRDSKVIGFTGTGGPADVFSDPVVEYVVDGPDRYELRLGTLDTNCVYGPSSLDKLALTYAGVAKDESIGEADKGMMKAVFCDPKRAADAYRYAAQDAVITLLVAERMRRQHTELYAKLGIPANPVPPMHGTPGLRMANVLLHHVRHTAAAGSAELGAAGRTAAAGLNRLKDLARTGSADALSDGRVSRYGKQTGDTHGGLLFGRTPYTFFHPAPGQFRDVDLGSCYPAIIRPMVVYLGRPLVLEPGNEPWTLGEAVAYLGRHADGPYAWFVKASGPISGFANTLIPSTVDALTNDNYRDRERSRVARKANTHLLEAKRADRLRERVSDRSYTALLTDEVHAGVVTAATWLMIQTLPPGARRQYEDLRAETIVFYPKKLVAGSGPEFDALVAKSRTGRAVDWRQQLDLGRMTRTTVEDIDEKYVSLRYPVGELTDRLVKLREAAGRDTAEGKQFKTLANTVYGVFASPFLPTSNPVAANVITGTARSLAYAMVQSLNGLLVITDGVLYRRDRIPTNRFADRMRGCPEYPLLAGDGGKFVPPETIPDDDAGFTDWYAGHALRFFGVAGRKEYESLFRLHSLAHKELPEGGTAFDGVFIDGSANYGKLVRADAKKWRVAELKARSFSERDKKLLAKWLCRVYRRDRLEELPEPIRSRRLLGVHDALTQAARATGSANAGARAVVPLGGVLPSVKTYKLIKPSAFVFRTARQRKRILAEWGRLTERTGCGPEVLALRRTYKGSLSAVARKVYDLIRSGHDRLEALNIDREWRPDSRGVRHGENIQRKRHQMREEFVESLVVTPADEPLTGLVLDGSAVVSMRS